VPPIRYTQFSTLDTGSWWSRFLDLFVRSGLREIERPGSGRSGRDQGLKDLPQYAADLRAPAAAERTAGQAHHSGEYGPLIIQAMETGQPRVIYGNVANHGLISTLPAGYCIEVPCLVDKNGI
jgi:alpha-galactosidase/6-phospho-beta-glucosidase family protein